MSLQPGPDVEALLRATGAPLLALPQLPQPARPPRHTRRRICGAACGGQFPPPAAEMAEAADAKTTAEAEDLLPKR